MGQATLLNMCMITDPVTGKVLVQDKQNSRWSGLTFPGGHVEPGESVSRSVRREVQEETGLSITGERLCGMVHWCEESTDERRIIFLYRASRFEGELVRESPEGKVFWMELPEMTASGRLSDGISDYLKLFLCEEHSEAFALCREGRWEEYTIL